MIVLGIESSCDETAIALVTQDKQVLSHINATQIKDHQKYGGVVPELASRNHLSIIQSVYEEAIIAAKIDPNEIDAIAVTAGPGLIGGVLVGCMFAKALALGLNKPIIAVNHLEGHALTARLTNDVRFPFLLLLVSGGHCQILIVRSVSDYELLGATHDDAIGEAFDKVAKMMSIPYPGGPAIEKLAALGDENKYQFHLNLRAYGECNFSLSGLKSSVKRLVDANELTSEFTHNVAASFQKTVCNMIIDRMQNACKTYEQANSNKQIVVAGGVAANQYILSRLKNAVSQNGYEVIAPPINLCMDNGVMIAWAGMERLLLGMTDDLTFEPRSRWPLGERNKV